MEVFLLVSIPPTRRIRRLRLVIQSVPQDLLKLPFAPNTVGKGYWPVNLNLLKPTTNRCKLLGSSYLAAEFEANIIPGWWPTFSTSWQVELLSSMGYDWKVRSVTNKQESSEPTYSEVLAVPNSHDGPKTISLTFGKGTYKEDVLQALPDLREELDEALIPQLQDDCPKDFDLHFDHSTNTILLVIDSQASPRSWAIDAKSWDMIGSPEPEAWFAQRMTRILDDLHTPMQQFASLASETAALIRHKCFLIENLTESVGGCPTDTSWRTMVQYELNSLTEWLASILKFIAEPLNLTLNNSKFYDFVKLHIGDIHPEAYGDLESFETHRSLRQLLVRFLHHLISMQTNRKDAFAKHRREAETELLYDHCFEHQRKLYNWITTISKDSSVSDYFLRCAKRLRLLKPTAEASTLPKGFSIDTVKALHSQLNVWMNSSVRKCTAGYGHKLFLPNSLGVWMPASNLDGCFMLWMARCESGELTMQLQSTIDPTIQHILQIESDGKQFRYEIPYSLDGYWNHNSEKEVMVMPIRSTNAVWLLKRSLFHGKEVSILRIDLKGSSTRAYPLVQHMRCSMISYPMQKQTMAFDDKLIFISNIKHCFDQSEQRYEAQTTEHSNYSMYCIEAQSKEHQLAAPRILSDDSPQQIVDRMKRYLPLGCPTADTLVKCRGDATLFAKFYCSGGVASQYSYPTTQTVTLRLFKLSTTNQSYRLLHFRKWSISTQMGEFFRQNPSSTTFKLGRLHYGLFVCRETRLLIAFDNKQMQLVHVNGRPEHTVCGNIGAPIDMRGFAEFHDYGLYVRRETPKLCLNPKFTLHRVRYTFL